MNTLASPPVVAKLDVDVCTEARCREAFTHPITCRCSCGGVFHSSAHGGAHFPTTAKRAPSNPYAQAGRDDAADAAFGIVPLTRRTNIVYDADESF